MTDFKKKQPCKSNDGQPSASLRTEGGQVGGTDQRHHSSLLPRGKVSRTARHFRRSQESRFTGARDSQI